MTPYQVRDFYKTGYKFNKATGLSHVTFHNWLKRGFVPEEMQYKIERLTEGALKVSSAAEKSGSDTVFRFHRGTLKESMKTAVCINSEEELKVLIVKSMLGYIKGKFNIRIDTYIHDDRINWDTHIVLASTDDVNYFPVGFINKMPEWANKEAL